MLDLVAWTSVIDFLTLVVSLWLGLYLITRGPRSSVSWLAGLTLWSLSGYFLDSFLHLNPPRDLPFTWWTGWTILFTAPLWVHLSTLLRPKQARWQYVLVGGSYAFALTLLVLELETGEVFGALTGDSFVYASAQRPGRWYFLVLILLVGLPLLALYNLYAAWRQRRRPALGRQFVFLSLATLLAVASAAYLTLSVWLGLHTPILVGQGGMGVALVLLGYGVARYNALISGRTRQVDFLYSLVAIALVVSLYVLVAYVSYLAFRISFSAFTLVLMLVILSHALYERGGAALERLFYRRRYRVLRASMRAFVRETQDHDLPGHLEVALQTLCRSLQCQWGWVALRDGDEWVTAAAYPGGRVSPPVSGAALSADEIEWGEELPDLGEGRVLVPLRTHGVQVGALVLGEKMAGQAYTEEDLDVLDALALQLAGVIDAARQQEAAVQQIEGLVDAFRQREQALRQELQSVLEPEPQEPHFPKAKMRRLVEDALRHLHDYVYLGQHELAGLGIVEQCLEGRADEITHLDRGRALSQVLSSVIEKLRPPGPEPRELSREWVQYTILHDAYVMDELNRDIMSKLYISESSFNRARRRAVRGVAQAVTEMEQAAQMAT